jgi:uncharacterized membrane protein YphA (DoxX/SURF4 family)
VKYLVLVARLLIGGLFVYASVHKIVDPASFAQAIRNYQFLPVAWTNLVAVVLPWIEIAAGALLILGIQTRPSALVITALMAAFLVGLFHAYSAGLDIDCGCFSHDPNSPGRITALTLLRDSSLFIVCVFILIADRGRLSVLGGRGAEA